MNDDLNIDKELLFPVLKETITRGHHLKIDLGKPAHLDVRRNFFSQRVTIPWNELPQHTWQRVVQLTRSSSTMINGVGIF